MKKNSNRMNRVNDEISKEIGNVIHGELKDPRIGTIVSVTKTDTSADLKYCKVYVSVLGDEKVKKDTMEALKHASGFLRKRVAEIINLRFTPELILIPDESMEYGARMSKLIEEANK